MRREEYSTKKWQRPGVPPIACQSVGMGCSARFDKQTVAPPGRGSATFLCCTLREAKRWAGLGACLLAALAAGCSDPSAQLNSADPAARIEAIRSLAQQRS